MAKGKPRKPRAAHGMECLDADNETWVGGRAVAVDGYLVTGAMDAKESRRMAAWLIRAAQWIEADDG